MSDEPPFEVDDLIVALLGVPSRHRHLDGRLQGITRLEKLVFLLDQDSVVHEALTEDAGFMSYNFGPFSQAVYHAVDTLVSAGFLRDSSRVAQSNEDSWEAEHIIGVDDSDSYRTRDFELTERGRRYFEALAQEVNPTVLAKVHEVKEKFGGLPLRQLVRYVYQKHPEYTDRSLIRDDILRP